jgi:hypothetical protein
MFCHQTSKVPNEIIQIGILVGHLFIINVVVRAFGMMVVHQDPLASHTIHANQALLKAAAVIGAFAHLMNRNLDHVAPSYDELLMAHENGLHIGKLYLY